MANAKFKYINGSGNTVTYDCPRNYSHRGADGKPMESIEDKTIAGAIKLRNFYGARIYKLVFEDIDLAQKEEFEAINSAGMGYFYPEGGTSPVYYGRIKFSVFQDNLETWVVNMDFEESIELVSEFSFITAKVVNNDSDAYANYNWEVAGVNTAWLIANKGLASDGHNLKIRDGSGAFFDYWVVEETWNTANTIFWIKKNSVDVYETFFFQFVINNNYNYTQDPDNIFDYTEDFEGYTVGSDINGQGGWSTLGGMPHTIQNDADGNYLSMNALNNKASVWRTLVTSGVGNIALYRFKVQAGSGTGFYKIGWGDVINAANYDIENGYYTQNNWNYSAPTTGYVKLYKRVVQVSTQLAAAAIVQDAAKYFWSYFFWDGQTKKSGFRDTEISAIDTTFSSQNKFFLGIADSSGVRNHCRIQQILIGKTAKTKPTVTIYGQP
jgi:hypothetical protein